jgi:hypothetical protein
MAMCSHISALARYASILSVIPLERAARDFVPDRRPRRTTILIYFSALPSYFCHLFLVKVAIVNVTLEHYLREEISTKDIGR